MKNIKIYTLLTACFFTTALAQAQSEMKKIDPRPITQAALPLSSSIKKDAKVEEPKNQVVIMEIDNQVIIPGGEEGRNIFNGTSTKPKPEIVSLPTTEPNVPAPLVKSVRIKNDQQQQ